MNTNVVDEKKDARAGNVHAIQPTLSVQSFANVEESAVMNKLVLIHSCAYSQTLSNVYINKLQ